MWGKAGGDGQEGGEEGLRSTAQGPEQVGAKVEKGQKEGWGQYGEKGQVRGLNQVFCTYGGATSSSGTSWAARTSFTLKGRDKKLGIRMPR